MIRTLAAALSALLLASAAFADTHQPRPRGLTEGEVRKVDKDAKKITIKHGPIPAIDMPAMTMVFQVKDPAMVDKVKVGDKVKFEAELLPGGRTVVTRIEVAK